MERNDIHRPSEIKPADYSFVGFDYYGPSIGVPIDKREIDDHMLRTSGEYVKIDHRGTCDVCGAHAHYVCVFYHELTNAYVVTGEDCAVKMRLSHGNMNAFRKAIGLARVMVAGQRKAFAFLSEKNIARAYEIWEAQGNSVDEKGRIRFEESTIKDIVSKLIRYGSISDAQTNFVTNLIAKIDQRPIVEAARKAEYDAAGPAPVGRQTVSGIVLSKKTVERNAFYYGDSGLQTKLLIQLENGSKVYGNSFACVERGDKVCFKATFEQSKDDVKFGFWKRAIEVLDLRPAEQELDANAHAKSMCAFEGRS